MDIYTTSTVHQIHTATTKAAVAAIMMAVMAQRSTSFRKTRRFLEKTGAPIASFDK